MPDSTTARLVGRWQAGDQQAAQELFQRYLEQLVALARSRLPARYSRRLDPEDVVQSAYRTFFAGARQGRFTLQRGGDLWRLLVAITLHKLHNQIRKNTAGKRSVHREQPLADALGLDGLLVPRALAAPAPEDAVALLEQLEQVMRRLEPLPRRMLELRLQGYSLEEIAEQTQRSDRTVIRVLERIKLQLEEACCDQPGP